jgi:hypothetical protein
MDGAQPILAWHQILMVIGMNLFRKSQEFTVWWISSLFIRDGGVCRHSTYSSWYLRFHFISQDRYLVQATHRILTSRTLLLILLDWTLRFPIDSVVSYSVCLGPSPQLFSFFLSVKPSSLFFFQICVLDLPHEKKIPLYVTSENLVFRNSCNVLAVININTKVGKEAIQY